MNTEQYQNQSMTLCLKDKLEELEKKLEEVFHSSEEDVEIAEGQVCVAYVDELYHRVRVIKKEPLKVDKLFLTFFFTLNTYCFNQYMFTIDLKVFSLYQTLGELINRKFVLFFLSF